jgi:hypothetical protein
MIDSTMLTEAGFTPAWFEDVADGDTLMVELPPGAKALSEFIVTDLRPSGMGPTARRFIATASNGTQSHQTLGGEYPCWILRESDHA